MTTSPRYAPSSMDATMLSTHQNETMRIICDDDVNDSTGYHSLDVDDITSNASSRWMHRLSSDRSITAPFFARRGSALFGPCSLRLLHLSDVSRSPSPRNINEPNHNHTSPYYQQPELRLNPDTIPPPHFRGTQSRRSVDFGAIANMWKLENDWKTSWKGICLIGGMWASSSHTLYSVSAVSATAMESLDVLVFDIGLMYCFTFLGISIGILLSSVILSQPSMVQSSQLTATYSIFVVCLSQTIASVVFYFIYYGNGDTVQITRVTWYILLISRFILGLGIGFIESALDNLLFEWFVIVEEAFFISTARPWTLFCKEMGHGSARLILVPLIYWTFSDKRNMFFSFLFGAILCAVSWLFMVCAAVKDSKRSLDEMHSEDQDSDNEANIELTSEEDVISPLSSAGGEEKPLIPRLRTVNKNEWMMKKVALHILSYGQWYKMGCVGFNASVFLSILYLSVNFGISFCFIVLSIVSFVEQYGYTDYTANLLLCSIPVVNVTCSGLLREYILAPLQSEWIIACVGWILFSVMFTLFSWLNIDGESRIWLPIGCVALFIIGYECFTAAGYELLLSCTKREIHGLVSSINSTANYFVSAVFVISFAALVVEEEDVSVSDKYQSAYLFLAFASYVIIIIIALLKIYHSDSV